MGCAPWEEQTASFYFFFFCEDACKKEMNVIRIKIHFIMSTDLSQSKHLGRTALNSHHGKKEQEGFAKRNLFLSNCYKTEFSCFLFSFLFPIYACFIFFSFVSLCIFTKIHCLENSS